jgi:stringent starvation protein B
VKESPTTPYLIRAIWEWCVDNGFTPYVAVKVDSSTRVPMEYVRNGEIVLNISPDASRNLKIGNDLIQFSARFNGVSREVSVPVAAVAGIFAKENGQGLAFQTLAAETRAVPTSLVPSSSNPGTPPKPSRGKPKLQIVK